MILFPLSTFYFFQSIVFKNDKEKMGYSGLAAVVAVNIVIYSYVVMAWKEWDVEKKEDSEKAARPALKADKKDNKDKTDLKKTS
jgi:hypothetical protein